MKYLTPLLILLALVCPRSSRAQSVTFEQAVGNPVEADIVFQSSSAETQYLGFNWVNAYCFGDVLGCVVQNQPASSSWTERIEVFSVGDWRIAADCKDQEPIDADNPNTKWQLHPCEDGVKGAIIQLRKNKRSLTVKFQRESLIPGKSEATDGPILKQRDARPEPPPAVKKWDKGASVYTLESAYNTKTGEVIGDGTVEQWKLLFAEFRMQNDLKTFQPQMAVKLIEQVKDLRQYNLVTSDRLGKLLDADEKENAAIVPH